MKQTNGKNRKELKNKMAQVFSGRIQILSTELQDILLDDLVTAFESRIEVLDRAQSGLQCFTDVGLKVRL